MQLSNLTYEGKKVYKDEYGNIWAPGDTKLVTDEQAARLLRFPVFLRPKTDAKTKEPAKAKAKDQLGQANPFTEKVAKGDKALFRARFAGLNKDQAEDACKNLKRSEIPCMLLKN